MSQLVYEIDDRDRIVAIGKDWPAFAAANGGAGLDSDAVVGRPLYDFIAGNTVRQVYAAIIARARSGRPVRFQYRCDAPAWRREFEMQVFSTAPDRVTFISTLLRETSRPPVDLFGVRPKAERPFVRICSWCHAVAGPSGQWLPLETAVAAAGVMEEARHGGVTHGICPDCVERIFGILRSHEAPGSAHAETPGRPGAAENQRI